MIKRYYYFWEKDLSENIYATYVLITLPLNICEVPGVNINKIAQLNRL